MHSYKKLPREVRMELKSIMTEQFGEEAWQYIKGEDLKVVNAIREEDGKPVRHLLHASSGDGYTKISVSDTSCWDGSRQETWRVKGIHIH